MEAEIRTLEREGMAREDRSPSDTPMRKPKLHHHFVNTHPDPDELCRWDSNVGKQKSKLEWYGPCLKEAERYNLPSTKENVDKACKEAGLCDLYKNTRARRSFIES